MAHDIIERKKMKEALKESEEKYRNLVEHMNQGMGIVNPDGILTYVNPRISEILEYSLEEMIGKDAFKFVDKECIDLVNKQRDKRKKGIEGKFELVFTSKTGKKIPVMVSARPILKNGKFVGSYALFVDITERKKAEETLKESEEKYRNLVQTIPQCVYSALPNGEILYMSPAVKNIFGYSTEEFQKDKNLWIRCIHKDDQKELLVKLEKLLKKGAPYVHEFRMKRKDGNIIWIRDHANASLDEKGKPIKISGIICDITERKRIEKKLKESEQRLKKLFDLSPVGIVIATVDEKIEYVNDTVCDMMGYKKEEAIGRMTKEFFADPKERDKSIEIIKKDGQRLNYTFHYKGKDGVTGVALANSKLIDLGKGLRLVIKLNDITELKKLEKDKKRLSEKVTRLTEKTPLTDNEKLVLYGLVRYPDLNDVQLSEKIGVKRSTITSIKNKLKGDGFYSVYNLPNFKVLGCELLIFSYGKMSPSKRTKKDTKKITTYPGFTMKTDTEYLNICASKSITDFQKNISPLLHGTKTDVLETTTLFFPLELSEVLQFFDFAPFLKHSLKLNIKDEQRMKKDIKKKKLTRNEKIVLYALSKYPELNDAEIAKKINKHRPTVTMIKNRLMENGFLQKIKVPDLTKVGYELLVFSHKEFAGETTVPRKVECLRIMKNIPSVILAVRGNRECATINVYKNYDDFKTTFDKYSESCARANNLIKKPTTLMLPLQKIKIQNLDFSPIVKKLLNVNI